MPRPLTSPDDLITRIRSDMERRTKIYDAEIKSQTEERDQEATTCAQRISALETLREPQIGPGQMPYLIMVEWFTEGELREHGHICGRTVRDSDSQVWTLFNSQTQVVADRIDWVSLVDTFLLRANQSVRLQDVQSYVEFGRHGSKTGKVNEFPNFKGKSDLAPKPVFETLDVKTEEPAQAEPDFAQMGFFVPKRLLTGDVVRIERNPEYDARSAKRDENRGFYSRYPVKEQYEFIVTRDKSLENSSRY